MHKLLLGMFFWLASSNARAENYDISLRGLGRPGGLSKDDPAHQRFRNLANELAYALTPRPLQPAETLGMSGFEFSFSATTTDIKEKAAYWQGQPGSPVLDGALNDVEVPSYLWTPTFQFRKGLPMSTEFDFAASYLVSSEMFMIGSCLKIAIH